MFPGEVPGSGGRVSALGVPGLGGCLLPGGAWSGGVSAPRGVPGREPPGQPLLQVVRILLECILVKVCMFVFEILLFAVAFECSKSISF